MNPNQITILQSDRIACKQITPQGVEPYGRGYLHNPHVRTLDGIASLHRLLTILNGWPQGFIIRGAPKDPSQRGIRRQYLPDDAPFVPAPRRWLCIDIDEFPYHGKPGRPSAVRHLIREALPTAFDGVAGVYQWSASAGLDGWGVYKIHLWYWLDRPLCDAVVKGWLKPYPVDPALYNPVQPHYTAAPVFMGVRDPLGRMPRVGMIVGESTVRVPDAVLSPEAYAAKLVRDAARRRRLVDLPVLKPRGFVRGALRRTVTRVLSAPEGGRHRVLLEEGDGLGQLVGAGHMSEANAVTALCRVAHAIYPAKRQAGARRAIEAAVRHGMNKPRRV